MFQSKTPTLPHAPGVPVDYDSQEFCREAVTWRHLRHPNILPFLGADLEQHRLAIISEWMDHGNINEYLKERKEVNRVQLVSRRLFSCGD